MDQEDVKRAFNKTPNIKKVAAEEPEKQPERRAVRPSLRDESSRDLAAKRAAELREHRGPQVFTGAAVDVYDVKHLEPEGWTYAWHTWSIYEQRQNSNMQASEARGWQPVPRERHPHLMPRDSDSEVIMDKGMILVELPTEIVEEYRRAGLKDARDQVRWKEQAIAGTPEGHLPRDHAQARPKIHKSYEPMPVPND
jgi:hypothetical protein